MALDNPQLQTQIEAGGRRWDMAGRDNNTTNALPYPIWGFGPPSSEPDTKKLDALLASLNGSAERFQTLWFSFLGLTLYLAIAALATTHRNLLLGEPQTLPILNIKVELLPFYVIAPLSILCHVCSDRMLAPRPRVNSAPCSCQKHEMGAVDIEHGRFWVKAGGSDENQE